MTQGIRVSFWVRERDGDKLKKVREHIHRQTSTWYLGEVMSHRLHRLVWTSLCPKSEFKMFPRICRQRLLHFEVVLD